MLKFLLIVSSFFLIISFANAQWATNSAINNFITSGSGSRGAQK